MLTGIPDNLRWQSGPVLVRTVLTSSHAISCLLYTLIASAIPLAGVAEDCDPLGSGSVQCRRAIFTVYTWRWEINLPLWLLDCEKIFFMFLIFVIVGREENIPMTKVSWFTVSSTKTRTNIILWPPDPSAKVFRESQGGATPTDTVVTAKTRNFGRHFCCLTALQKGS